jgi:hypothetical protein
MRERDKPHSYRHEPSAPMENYSLLIMGEGDGDEDGSGGDEDGSGGTSPSRQGARTELLSPEFGLRSGGGTELFGVSRQYI